MKARMRKMPRPLAFLDVSPDRSCRPGRDRSQLRRPNGFLLKITGAIAPSFTFAKTAARYRLLLLHEVGQCIRQLLAEKQL